MVPESGHERRRHVEPGARFLGRPRGDRGGDIARRVELRGTRHCSISTGGSGSLHEVGDHRIQPEFHAVVRVVDSLDAVFHQRLDLLGRDRAAPAAENLDVLSAPLLELVDHVFEKLVVAALVAGDRDRVCILLDRGAYDVEHAAVVAQVDDLDALRLDQAAHDVDRGIVAVEQGGGRDKTQRGRGFRGGLRNLVCRSAHLFHFP